MAEQLLGFDVGHTQPVVNPVTPLIRVDAHDFFDGTIWSPKVWWIVAHWDGWKSKPHFNDPKQCPGCIEELPRREKGVLKVQLASETRPGFLEITPLCGSHLTQQHPETKSLRGLLFHVQRERRTKRSPLKLTITGDKSVMRLIGPDENPVRTYARIWKCEHLLEKWLENPKVQS